MHAWIAMLMIIVPVAFGICGAVKVQAKPRVDAYGFKKCGHFDEANYTDGKSLRIYVRAKKMRCKLAVRIQREYWLGPDARRQVFNGGSGAAGYILLDRFPGYRCTSGAGAGACTKGQRAAAYHNRILY